MKFNLRFFTPILLFVACTNVERKQDMPPALFLSPQKVEFNAQEGYDVNLFSGDSIVSILVNNGDSLKTGKRISVNGKLIKPESVKKPKETVLINTGKSIDAHSNKFPFTSAPEPITVHHDSISRISLNNNQVNRELNFIINAFGDTIKTGVPIPAKGRTVKVIHPKPEEAMLPRFKDEVISDLQYLDVDQGMASSYVNAILEDKDGNIWFGTWGGGVTKYDGVSFVHFAEKEGLSSSIVWSILEDKNGDLWFGTEGGGVCKYDGKTFMHLSVKEGMSSPYVNSILEDKNGNLWFATNTGGISKYEYPTNGNDGTLIHYTKNEGLASNAVKTMLEDSDGNIWLGTWGAGANKLELSKEGVVSTILHYSKNEGITNDYIANIFQDKSGSIWFGTWGDGILLLETDVLNQEDLITHYTTQEGLSNNFVKSIFEDRSGNFWIGTNGGGMNKFQLTENKSGGLFEHYTEKEGLSNNYILSILEDSNGNLWFGTNGGGVNKYDRKSFTHFTENQGLSNNYVMAILEDSDGNLWFGTNRGGVTKYDGESFLHFSEKEGLPSNYVTSILEDKNGNIWFGTWGGGISKYTSSNGGQDDSFINYQESNGLSSNYIFSIIEDTKGYLWIATNEGGVNKLEPQANGESVVFTHYTEEEGLSNNDVWSILEDKNGNFWFGTDGGGVTFFELDEDGISGFMTHITEREGLIDNHVTSLHESKNGTLWFGTNGRGICSYEREPKYNAQPQFTYYTEKQGLSDNVVWSILQDRDENLWLSTENGITRFIFSSDSSSSHESSINPEKRKEEKVEIVRFERNDGLKGLDFSSNSAYLDSKNRFWWGSGKSLTMLNMHQYSRAVNHPNLYFRQLDINEEFIDFRNIHERLKKEISFTKVQDYENYPLNLELSYSQNHLTFHFSAIDWSAPHKIQYSHKMEGLNSSWSQPNSDATIDYRNLPYGDYVFVIRAIGESGKWSKAFRYEFKIHPPWWHTWWARTLYVIFATLAIWSFVRFRTAQLKERQKELENEIDIATVEIREQKNEAEKQRDEVSKQKEIVEKAHKEITDSIQYAKRIQSAILPPQSLVKEYLPNSFIFYKPKDVVAGDFYWMEQKNGKVFFAAADCTGHGVPGAMVSVICNGGLNRSVREHGLTDPAKILDKTREIVIEEFEKSEEVVQDGMDIALCTIEGNILQYAGANNPLWLIRNGELHETKADKQPIGKYDNAKPYTTHTFELQKGDTIYVFSDGYADQFGGEKFKKFKTRAFKEMLISIQNNTVAEQLTIIEKAFEEWRGDLEQIDDVCVIGIRI